MVMVYIVLVEETLQLIFIKVNL